MINKNMSMTVLDILQNVAESIYNDPEFDNIDKIIVIVSKPVPREPQSGFLTTFSNTTNEEIMTMCDVTADALDALLEEKSVAGTAARRMQ